MVRRKWSLGPGWLLILVCAISRSGEGDAGATGLDAAKEALGRLIPLAIVEGRLALDRAAWERNREKEPDDPEERNKLLKRRIAREMGIPEEQVTENWIKHWGRRGGDGGVEKELFGEVLAAGGGGPGGMSGGFSGTRHQWTAERPNFAGWIEYDSTRKEFSVKLLERTGPQRILQIQDDPYLGLTVRLASQTAKDMLVLCQSPHGPVSVTCFRGDERVALSGANFADLLQRQPDQVQIHLLRALGGLGISLPPSRELPTVMALATSGYSAAAPEAAKRAEALIRQVSDEDAEVRDRATKELIQLFPLAIQDITQAAAKAEDAEAKTRLEKAIAAHPGIARARPYVEKEKLHEDRAYLLEIMARTPFFKAAARARLTVLYGRDHGDDPAAWPKP